MAILNGKEMCIRDRSKMTFVVDHKPTRQEEKEIETEMNRLIELDMPVTYEFVDRDHIPAAVSYTHLSGTPCSHHGYGF